MDSKTATCAMIDSTVQGILWAVLCFVLIQNFDLERYWYLVCAAVLVVEIGILFMHQRITFPGLVKYLGYEPNERLEAVTKFNINDHWINILTMFVIVYFCLAS